MLLMRLEKPLFFLSREALESLVSSEYRLELLAAAAVVVFISGRGGVVSIGPSPVEKLADCFRVGVVMLALGVECAMMGGPGRRREFWYPDAFEESSALVELPPPKNSSETRPFLVGGENGE